MLNTSFIFHKVVQRHACCDEKYNKDLAANPVELSNSERVLKIGQRLPCMLQLEWHVFLTQSVYRKRCVIETLLPTILVTTCSLLNCTIGDSDSYSDT